MDILTYKNTLDTLEEEFIKKVEDNPDNMVQYIKELVLNATIFGTATAGNEIIRMSHKKIAMADGVWQKVIYSQADEGDIQKAKGTLDRSAEFWDEYALKIKGKYSQDKLDAVSEIMKRAVTEGLTQREIESETADALDMWNKQRLETIARTETTKCFNYGRIEAFRENAKNGGIVRAVKFSAIMDDRVSDTCRARHGKVFDINDPRIDQNTPPLHPRCRSLLVPVDKWDYEEKYKNQSSKEWDMTDITDTQPDKTWGNAFAYGGKKPEPSNIDFEGIKYERSDNMKDKEVTNYMKSKAGNYKNLTQNEIHALSDYKGGGSGISNYVLRHSIEADAGVKKKIELLSSAINKNEIGENLILYRGITDKDLAESFDRGLMFEGAEFRDMGFASTSLLITEAQKFAEGGIILEIKAKSDTKGIFMESGIIGNVERECEVLLDNGRKYIITGTRTIGKLRMVEVALID